MPVAMAEIADTNNDQSYYLLMKQMAASRFRDKCLAIIDQVGEDGIVITKHGKPVAKLIPIRAESAALIGVLKEHLKIKGDLPSTGVQWDAES